MVESVDIENLVSGICRPFGVVFAIRRVPLQEDSAELSRMAGAYLVGRELHQFDTIRSVKRRAEFIAGRLAARSAIRKLRPNLDVDRLQVIRESTGAPRVEGCGSMGLSISHSGAFAVAVAAPFLVGIDLETDDLRPDALAKYFLSDYERLSIAKLDGPEKSAVVNRLWTRKEAACKVGGWGGTLAFAQLDCSGPMTTVQERTLGLATDSFAGYVASLAYERHKTNFDGRYAASCVESVRFHG